MLDIEGGPSTPCRGPVVCLIFKVCPIQALLAPWHILDVGVEDEGIE